MTLHLVNKPPSNPALSSCVAAALPGDAILMLENGVYCAATIDVPDNVRSYALNVDIEARGLDERIDESVEVIDAGRFVELACEHNPIVTWS